MLRLILFLIAMLLTHILAGQDNYVIRITNDDSTNNYLENMEFAINDALRDEIQKNQSLT